MDYAHFKEIVDEIKRKKTHLFELEHDQILSMTEIDAIEMKMDIKLPLAYRRFISEFGGGLFGIAPSANARAIFLLDVAYTAFLHPC